MKKLFREIESLIAYCGMENYQVAGPTEAAEAIISLICKRIDEVDNTREYTPREDMFGVGYDQAKKDIKLALMRE